MRTPGSLAVGFMKLRYYKDTLATPALKLVDLYFCLWDVTSSSPLRRYDSRTSSDSFKSQGLASDSDILLQIYSGQGPILFDTKRATEVLCEGVVIALQTSDTQVYHADRP